MRRMIPVLAVSAAVALAAAGCGQTPARVDGNAAPLMSVAPSGAAGGETSAPASAPASSPGKPGNADQGDALLLTAAGLGKLKLGMSVAEAQATGLIGNYSAGAGTDCGDAPLKAGGGVGFNKNYGLYTIGVSGKAGPSGTDFSGTAPLRTPEGIKLGSRLDTVKKDLPGYADVDMSAVSADGTEDHTSGRAGAKLTGHVSYEFSFYKGTLYTLHVTDMTYKCGE